jgi:EAL domain-containing protein (putative c-di-GMP-specific phosphodiesterase class I)
MHAAPPPEVQGNLAYLEHYPEPGMVQRIWLSRFPFRIGRTKTADHPVYSSQVSKFHAEIRRAGDQFLIRDVGSTNGTFVNGQRVSEAVLWPGDIIHVAHKEFRFGCGAAEAPADSEGPNTEYADSRLPPSFIHGNLLLREMLTQHRVKIVFQPIVNLETWETAGYEALGRGTHDKLSPNPFELFQLAERCQLAPELSRLFRMTAVKEACALPAGVPIFFNVHPLELENRSFIDSLAEVAAAMRPDQRMILEVHEDVVADSRTIGQLRDQLRARAIGLAFDDFGAGQTRLTELAEAPPDYIKLDRKLIRDLDRSPARQELLQALNRVAHGLGIRLVAEGIETAREAETCLRLGCHLGQGFLFGSPQPAAGLGPRKPPDTRKLDLSQLRQRLKTPRG